MVSADMGLTLDDIKAGTPDPFFAQCWASASSRRASRAPRFTSTACFFILRKNCAFDDVPRVLSAKREHKEHVALAREFVQLYAPDGAQVVLRGEGGFERGVTRRAGV